MARMARLIQEAILWAPRPRMKVDGSENGLLSRDVTKESLSRRFFI